MSTEQSLVDKTILLANTVEVIKGTIEKVGLEFIAPLPEAVQDEKISRAINRVVGSEGK